MSLRLSKTYLLPKAILTQKLARIPLLEEMRVTSMLFPYSQIKAHIWYLFTIETGTT